VNTNQNLFNSQKKKLTKKIEMVWEKFIPQNGQSDYIVGEMVRGNERLRSEAHRNGNINWWEDCHPKFIETLRKHLNDDSLFDEATLKQINADLNTLSKEEEPYIEYDIYNRLKSCIVQWYLKYGDKKREHDPTIKC
jgi:hypothetical protein